MKNYVSRGEQFVPKTVEAVISRRYWLTEAGYAALEAAERREAEVAER